MGIGKRKEKFRTKKVATKEYLRARKIANPSNVAYTDSPYKNAEQKAKNMDRIIIAVCNKERNCDRLKWKTAKRMYKDVKTIKTWKYERSLEDANYLARMLKESYTDKVSE